MSHAGHSIILSEVAFFERRGCIHHCGFVPEVRYGILQNPLVKGNWDLAIQAVGPLPLAIPQIVAIAIEGISENFHKPWDLFLAVLPR